MQREDWGERRGGLHGGGGGMFSSEDDGRRSLTPGPAAATGIGVPLVSLPCFIVSLDSFFLFTLDENVFFQCWSCFVQSTVFRIGFISEFVTEFAGECFLSFLLVDCRSKEEFP